MLERMGPNPQAWKRFVLDLYDREPRGWPSRRQRREPERHGGFFKQNQKIEGRVALERRVFENLFAEVTGQNKIPVNIEMAKRMGRLAPVAFRHPARRRAAVIVQRYRHAGDGGPVQRPVNDAMCSAARPA
jgi:hypothetical protein